MTFAVSIEKKLVTSCPIDLNNEPAGGRSVGVCSSDAGVTAAGGGDDVSTGSGFTVCAATLCTDKKVRKTRASGVRFDFMCVTSETHVLAFWFEKKLRLKH